MRNTKITTGDLKDGAAMPRPKFSSMHENGMETQALYLYLNSEFCAQLLASCKLSSLASCLATVDVARSTKIMGDAPSKSGSVTWANPSWTAL